MMTGDLVHVIADGADWGLGIIIEGEEAITHAYRVMLTDGKTLYFHAFEFHGIDSCKCPVM